MSKSTCLNDRIDIPKECNIEVLNNLDKIQEIAIVNGIGETVLSLVIKYDGRQLKCIVKRLKRGRDILNNIINRLNRYLND